VFQPCGFLGLTTFVAFSWRILKRCLAELDFGLMAVSHSRLIEAIVDVHMHMHESVACRCLKVSYVFGEWFCVFARALSFGAYTNAYIRCYPPM
jgi:hypothetical protein